MKPSMHPSQIYGGFWIRLIAGLCDWAILSIPVGFTEFGLLALLEPVPFHSIQQDAKIGVIRFCVRFCYSLAYFWILQTSLQGTPGKRILGLRLVSQTLSPPTFKQVLIRWFMACPSFLALFVGFISIGTNPSKQGWHDRVAQTYVIRKSALQKRGQQRLVA